MMIHLCPGNSAHTTDSAQLRSPAVKLLNTQHKVYCHNLTSNLKRQFKVQCTDNTFNS